MRQPPYKGSTVRPVSNGEGTMPLGVRDVFVLGVLGTS